MSLDVSNVKTLVNNQASFIKKSIFSSTINTQESNSDIYSNNSVITQNFRCFKTIDGSKSFCESILTPQRKIIDIDNPQIRIIIPIITQSKYKFQFEPTLPNISRKQFRNSDPLFEKKSADFGKRNLNQMKKYKKIWEDQIEIRKNDSLLSRSLQKCKTYIQNHNRDAKIRRKEVNFENYLRNRHQQQIKNTIQSKGRPCPEIKGLKGKKSTNKSIFEQCYSIEEVYKTHK